MFFFNRIHHSWLKISLIIDSLLSKSKHLKMLTHPLLHHKIIVRERVIYDQILLDGLAINELPKNKLDKRHFYSALRDIELLRDSIILHLKLPKHKKVHNFS